MVPTSAPCKSRSLATAAPPPEAAKWSGEDLQRERTPKADKVAANSRGRALIMSRRPHRRRRHAIAHDVHDRWGYNGCSALLTHPMLAPHRRGMHSGHTHAPGTLARTHARASSCFVFLRRGPGCQSARRAYSRSLLRWVRARDNTAPHNGTSLPGDTILLVDRCARGEQPLPAHVS